MIFYFAKVAIFSQLNKKNHKYLLFNSKLITNNRVYLFLSEKTKYKKIRFIIPSGLFKTIFLLFQDGSCLKTIAFYLTAC